MAELTCIVVTPEETALEERTTFIALPLQDGEKGIAPGHSPMIGRLGTGELRLGRGADAKRFYVNGGFVQIADNLVSVLTHRAIPSDAIDPKQVQREIEDATSRRAHSDELIDAREQAVHQGRAQLRIASKAEK